MEFDIDEMILPMTETEYVNWLLTDRYGGNNIEVESVLNFYNIINSAAGWEEKELLTLKVLANESRKV